MSSFVTRLGQADVLTSPPPGKEAAAKVIDSIPLLEEAVAKRPHPSRERLKNNDLPLFPRKYSTNPSIDWFFFPLFQRGTEGDSTALMIHPTIAIGSDAEVFIPPNLPSPREAFIFPLF